MSNSLPDHTLWMTREEMQKLGYQIVDMIVDHYESVRDSKVTQRADRETLDARLTEPIPYEGVDPTEVLSKLEQDVFSAAMPAQHPRFFAFVPGPSNFVGAMAASLCAGYNAFAGTWLEASGPAKVELMTLDWLRELIGMPEGTGGIFTSGGSMANLTALVTARHIKLGEDFEDGVIYYSSQTHSSVDKGLRIAGFRRSQIRKLPADANFRLSMDDLVAAVAEDRAKGLKPFCVVANAGTTNTGAIDPLPELVTFCRENDLWLHADGAYGGAAVLYDEGRALLAGIEDCDSVTIDPHKWLFQPFALGCVLVKDRRALRSAFTLIPEYLKDTEQSSEDEVNFYEYGMQLTRDFNALRLWMSIKIFGMDAFRKAVKWGSRQAELVQSMLEADPDRWEIVTEASIGIINFRYRREGMSEEGINRINWDIVDIVLEDGYMLVTTTNLRGQTVLRMCTINPRTTEEDLRESVRRLAEYGDRLLQTEAYS